ncbi:MAG: cytochrome b [Burkholderiales bacterium]|nr:cytochrome b [Burkholderiales bacterium]
MNQTSYSTPTKILHWLTAILVLVAFIYGPGGPEERIYSAARDFDRQLHETLGMSVLVLSVIRILWRAFDRRPQPEPAPAWMLRAAAAAQGLLYALLFIVPLSAITGAWLEGHPLTLLRGAVVIPPPFGPSHDLGEQIAELHGWLGDVILWLAGAHAAAALFHHYFLKDGVLRSMLPGRR